MPLFIFWCRYVKLYNLEKNTRHLCCKGWQEVFYWCKEITEYNMDEVCLILLNASQCLED